MDRHGNVIPDDPPPGNPGSMPGWNSQWSLEHQQFYYVNTSTGERRWYLPTVTTPPPQPVQIKPEDPPTATQSSAPPQKIQRKAVGIQSIRVNQASPAAAAQHVQANTGSVRAPLPQATDSYFPPSTVSGQYQAPQIAKPLTPAPTPAQCQVPQQSHAVQSQYQQLDFSGQFASPPLEQSQAGTNVPAGSSAQSQSSQAFQEPQTAQSPLGTNDVPIYPMVNQPNSHNFSSQPSNTTYFPPPPTDVQNQSFPAAQAPDQPCPTGSDIVYQNFQPNVNSSPLPAPQSVLRPVPPPPPPRNISQYQYQSQQKASQTFAPPGQFPANVSVAKYSQQYTTSPSPVTYHAQQKSDFVPIAPPTTQQYAPVPGSYQPVEQQQPLPSGVQQAQPFQQYAPAPPPGNFQQGHQSSPYQQTTSPIQQQNQGPSQSPAIAQYSFPPPPTPGGQRENQRSEALRQTSPSAHQQYASPIQSQTAPPLATVISSQTTTSPPPQQQYHSPASAIHYGTSTGQTAYHQQSATINPTPPPLQHYPTAPIPAHASYEPPPQTQPPPSAPSLHRYSSAPEPVALQSANGASHSGYGQSPASMKNPYAQQVAHANSFYGPPPQRVLTQSNTVPQRIPVAHSQSYGQVQPQVSSHQQPQGGYQAPGSAFAQPPRQQQSVGQPQGGSQTLGSNFGQSQQQQHLGQPQVPYQNPNQSQYHQGPPQSSSPAHTLPVPPPRKSSSGIVGSMGSMGKKLTGYSKTAVDKSKRFSVSQPGLMKWGTRAAVGIVAVGALALGVDAVSDSSLFEGAGGGEFAGGDFGGGDAAAFDGGGGGDFGGGDAGGFESGGGGGYEAGAYEGGESAMNAQTAVDANAAQLALEQEGRNNAMMLTDPVGTEYEVVHTTTAADVNALI